MGVGFGLSAIKYQGFDFPAYRMYRVMMEMNLSLRFINIGKSTHLEVLEVLPQRNYARTTCIFDCSCGGSLELLKKVWECI